MCERQLSNQNPIFSFSREYVCSDYIIHDRYYHPRSQAQARAALTVALVQAVALHRNSDVEA
jgi:hypothetical protein